MQASVVTRNLPLFLFISLFITAIGALLGVSQYDLAIGGATMVGLAAIWLCKGHYIVYYYLLMGAIVFPGVFSRFEGIVGLTWIRNTILSVFFFMSILVCINRLARVLRHGSAQALMIATVPWVLYLGVSMFWCQSPLDGLRYYNKFIMALFLAWAFLLDTRISSHQAHKALLVGFLIFLVVSTLAIPLKSLLWPHVHTRYVQLFSGRFNSKYYLVFASIISASAWLSNRQQKWLLFLTLGSLSLLVALLQRGGLLAVVVGLFVLHTISFRFTVRSISRGTLIFGVMVLVLATLFASEEYQAYMFFPGYRTDDFLSYLTTGDISLAFSLIHMKGRVKMWELALAGGVPLFGKGLGATSVLMVHLFGRINQIHNDFIQYLLEMGYFGIIFYVLTWIFMFALGYRFRRSQDTLLHSTGLGLFSYTAALFVWSAVDHVADYGNMTVAYWFILAAIGVKREMEVGDSPNEK